ncbi:cold-shock protein [Rhodococcus aetherivorans]|uniref:cold-shock protein n=1 Tax=Rhodococcus aetherivorans TaxID=191292 RepID=UPI0009DBB3E4|nr:cold shock domain-containing protein [Rhodococcus aetherivorans]
MSVGVVTSWDDYEGWGVIESADTPGGCWVHFGSLDHARFRKLEVGATVEFSWRSTTNQDGYYYVATAAEPVGD